MKTMQRGPVQRGDSVRVRAVVRLVAVLAVMLAATLAGGTAEAAPVPRTPVRVRTNSSSRTATAEPKAVRGKAAAGKTATRSGKAGVSGAKAGAAGAKVGATGARAGAGSAGAKGHAGKSTTRDAKDSLKESRPRAQVRRRRGRKDDVDDPPVTMWRVKGKAPEAESKPAQREVATHQAGDKSLTVEDFEKAASGPAEPEAAAETSATAAKSDAEKPLTRSAVRAANEKAEADRAARERIAAADRLALRPTGERLPMVSSGAAKKSVAARPAPAVAPAVTPSATLSKTAVLPQVQANGPKALVVARVTALPRLEAGADVSDPVASAAGSDDVADAASNDVVVRADGAQRADVFAQSVMTQNVVARDAETEDAAPVRQAPAPLRAPIAPLRTPISLRAPTHEEMAEAVTQPVVLPGLYRDGRLVVPAPLKGTREILVHQNTMADAEGLERIRNESELNRLRVTGQLVNLPESESLRLNPELAANRRCARVWSVKFAEDMSRAFYARFGEPLKITSAVRTVAYQLRLQRVNGNAAGIGGEAASPHLTGQALDFAKSGMTVEEIAWMRGYLLPLMQAGKVDVEEEFQQACFHISVYKSYMPSQPSRRRGARVEVAQLKAEPVRPAAKIVRVVPPTEDDRQ